MNNDEQKIETITEAVESLTEPISVILRITATKEAKRSAAMDVAILANIITKWALQHLLSYDIKE